MRKINNQVLDNWCEIDLVDWTIIDLDEFIIIDLEDWKLPKLDWNNKEIELFNVKKIRE
jgi:hypothetical protein